MIAACAAQAIAGDPRLAVVRIPSHGISGTVIYSTAGRSIILTCAHGFLDDYDRPDPLLLHKPLQIDGPPQPYAPRIVAPARLVAVDFAADLALIELPNGPFYWCPVARSTPQRGETCWSDGYDEMRSWPAITARPAHVCSYLHTQERPWHGRSGGGLFSAGGLVGVCHGYEVDYLRRGIYVDHATVCRFLRAKGYGALVQDSAQAGRPESPFLQSASPAPLVGGPVPDPGEWLPEITPLPSMPPRSWRLPNGTVYYGTSPPPVQFYRTPATPRPASPCPS